MRAFTQSSAACGCLRDPNSLCVLSVASNLGRVGSNYHRSRRDSETALLFKTSRASRKVLPSLIEFGKARHWTARAHPHRRLIVIMPKGSVLTRKGRTVFEFKGETASCTDLQGRTNTSPAGAAFRPSGCFDFSLKTFRKEEMHAPYCAHHMSTMTAASLSEKSGGHPSRQAVGQLCEIVLPTAQAGVFATPQASKRA